MSQSYLDWKVGDKVVCVDDVVGRYSTDPTLYYVGDLDGLVAGNVYTIREIGPSAYANGKISVKLREIVRPTMWCGEGVYAASRFRKVQPRKTSIAIFEQMLHPSKQGVDA